MGQKPETVKSFATRVLVALAGYHDEDGHITLHVCDQGDLERAKAQARTLPWDERDHFSKLRGSREHGELWGKWYYAEDDRKIFVGPALLVGPSAEALAVLEEQLARLNSIVETIAAA